MPQKNAWEIENMKYINQLNAYWNWARLNPLPSKAGYLYFALLDCANAACWKREINVPNSTLQAMAGLDKNGLVRYRNQLIQNGLIEYKPGNRGSNGTYKIIPFRGNQSDTEIDTKNDTQTQPKTILKRNQKGESTLLLNKDIDKDIDISPPILSPPVGETRKRFAPPTVEEVRKYCEERRNGIDPYAFINHYTANGWMRGKTKIKDWKACVRTWEVKRKNNGVKNGEVENTKPKYLNPL